MDGGTQIIEVKYLWKAEICTTCCCFGHSNEICEKSLSASDKELVNVVNDSVLEKEKVHVVYNKNVKRNKWFVVQKKKRK